MVEMTTIHIFSLRYVPKLTNLNYPLLLVLFMPSNLLSPTVRPRLEKCKKCLFDPWGVLTIPIYANRPVQRRSMSSIKSLGLKLFPEKQSSMILIAQHDLSTNLWAISATYHGCGVYFPNLSGLELKICNF